MFQFQPEEFIVEEIMLDGRVLEMDKPFVGESGQGKFCHFVLQKRQWNTAQALKTLSRVLHTTHKRFNSAGTKDRNAITVQLCSAFSLAPNKLMSATIKDIKILGAWNAEDKVRMGDLLGNRFTITLNKENCGSAEEPTGKRLAENAAKCNYRIANYFGEQRFGSLRRNTHLVGKLLLQANFKEAAMNFLTYTDENEKGGGREARQKLASEANFKDALDYYPPYLKYERTVIAHLAEQENDFVGALRRLPRPTLLMFVHAYQSYLFNELLRRKKERGKLESVGLGDWYCLADEHGLPLLKEKEEREATAKQGKKAGEERVKRITSEKEAAEANELIAKGKAFPAGNLVGYESVLTEEEKALLESEGVGQEQFILKSIPELSSRGAFRPLFVLLKDFKVLEEQPARIQFALPAGAYATVALKKLLEA